MNVIDLFAGCGGLSYGFKEAGVNSVGFLEIDKHCITTLKSNFKNNKTNDSSFLKYDIQNIFQKNHKSVEVSYFFDGINNINVDGIIGGPPCQAYSLDGRARDPGRMNYDYRNFLFESYIEWLKKIKPNFFVLENVMGMLSANPGGKSIPDLMSKAFKEIGYAIPEISKKIVYDLSDFGASQKRRRVILFGVNKKKCLKFNQIIENFYNTLDNQMCSPKDVSFSIKNLPYLLPLKKTTNRNSHSLNSDDPLHFPRFHNNRDIKIFRTLAADISSENPKFNSSSSKLRLYNEKVGKAARFQKYNVLKWDKPSNTITRSTTDASVPTDC